jgi:hypothetical protein
MKLQVPVARVISRPRSSPSHTDCIGSAEQTFNENGLPAFAREPVRRAETVGAGYDSLSPPHAGKPRLEWKATVCGLRCSVSDNRCLLMCF